MTESSWWVATVLDAANRRQRLVIVQGARDEAQALRMVARVLKPREAPMGAQRADECVENDTQVRPKVGQATACAACQELVDEMCVECAALVERVFGPRRLKCVLCEQVTGEDDGVRCLDCQAFMCSCGGDARLCPECDRDRRADAAESRAELRREMAAEEHDESEHINHHNPDR